MNAGVRVELLNPHCPFLGLDGPVQPQNAPRRLPCCKPPHARFTRTGSKRSLTSVKQILLNKVPAQMRAVESASRGWMRPLATHRVSKEREKTTALSPRRRNSTSSAISACIFGLRNDRELLDTRIGAPLPAHPFRSSTVAALRRSPHQHPQVCEPHTFRA